MIPMAYQALYRKWRPKTFEEVLGQGATVKTLRRQIETGRIAHAYLFCGCRGTGKTTIAKIMSRAINCEHPNHGDPCGECACCRDILKETSLDVIEMDAASKSRVEDMRDLLEQVVYPPQMGKYKVYIIDEVHMLSTSAFNALLKTMEEPPEYLVFILATTEPQKVPATILSRVQRFDFGRIPTHLMVERMKEALAEMNLSAEEEALQIIARSAEGAMRDAFSILDMCVSAAEGGIITADGIRDLLGTSDKDFLFRFADQIAKRNEDGVIRQVDELMRSGKEPQVFLKDLSAHFRSLLTVKSLRKNAAELLSITPEEEKIYRRQAETFSAARLLSLLDLFMTAEGSMRYAAFPRIGLEAAVLRACQPVQDAEDSALVEKVSELENELQNLKMRIAEGATDVQPKVNVEVVKAAESKLPPPAASKASPPVDEGELWKKAFKLIKQKNPAIVGFLNSVRSLGLRDGTLSLVVDEKDSSRIAYLLQPERKTLIASALFETAGYEVPFTISIFKKEKTGEEHASQQAQLVETFGREAVQIIEGGNP